MKHYLKLILYPSSINLSWIEERHTPLLKNINIMWHLVLIDKWGMAESKWSFTLLQQRNDVAYNIDKLYSTVQQSQILMREVYLQGHGCCFEWANSILTRLFSCGLRVTRNGNASEMWLTRPPLEVQSRVLTMLPVICTVYHKH